MLTEEVGFTETAPFAGYALTNCGAPVGKVEFVELSLLLHPPTIASAISPKATVDKKKNREVMLESFQEILSRLNTNNSHAVPCFTVTYSQSAR